LTNCIQAAFSGAGGATTNTLKAELGSAFTSTATTFTDITAVTVTVTDNTGNFFAGFSSANTNDTGGAYNYFQLLDAAEATAGSYESFYDFASKENFTSFTTAGDNDGQVLKAQCKVSAGTISLFDDGITTTQIDVLEVS